MNRFDLNKDTVIKFKIGDRVKPDNRKMSWESKKRGEVIEFGSWSPDNMSWIRWDDSGSIVCWSHALLMYE